MVRLEITVAVIMYQKNNIKLKNDYAEKISETTFIEIQIQHWGGNRHYQWKVLILNIYQIRLIIVEIKANLNSVCI